MGVHIFGTDHGFFEELFEEKGLSGAKKIKQVIAEGVPVLLQESLCTVVHHTSKVHNPKSLGLAGLGLDVAFISSVYLMQLLQHGLICPLRVNYIFETTLNLNLQLQYKMYATSCGLQVTTLTYFWGATLFVNEGNDVERFC